MVLVSKYPSNKAHFIQLKEFCKEVIEILNSLKVTPILYGSLAYFGYTKEKEIVVNDIDFLIPEKSFKKIINALKKKEIKYNYLKKWHTLQIFRNDLKVELDSMDFWQKDLPRDFKKLDFNGLKLTVVSLLGLTNIYKKASEVSEDNPSGNLKKYLALKKIEK